jgi:ferredoxin-NADP reductase
MLQAAFAPVVDAARRLAQSAWLRPLNDPDALNDMLAQVNPTWSLNKVKAVVVEIRQETPDTKTFVLRPNQNWIGFAAGQHVAVEVEIKGVRHHRTYSLSSAPQEQGLICLTVKRQPNGKASNALHDDLKVGQILVLSAPNGDFVLPRELPGKVLLLSAGSGITPVMSMLRDLHWRGYAGDVVFIHACRKPEDAIFAAELHQLTGLMPRLRLHLHFTAEVGRLSAESLIWLVPDYAERASFLCGPQAFMEMVRARWEAEGLSLASESFSGPQLRSRTPGAAVRIRATRSEQSFTAPGERALLVEAESAGLSPKFGCRMGICRTCQCRKQSGTVENLLTGEVSSEPNQLIQLCVSAARSDLELDL